MSTNFHLKLLINKIIITKCCLLKYNIISQKKYLRCCTPLLRKYSLQSSLHKYAKEKDLSKQDEKRNIFIIC